MIFWVELIAAGLALLYVMLAIFEHRSCWLAAAFSAALYLLIFTNAMLYMEAALQSFYILIAAYGWLAWGRDNTAQELPIQRWSPGRHALLVCLILFGTGLAGWLLATYTNAAMPWLDSFTTIAAIATTWLVARKVLENWLYWVVIDLVSIYLYLSRDLYTTAALFAGYVVLAAAGYVAWRRRYKEQCLAEPLI